MGGNARRGVLFEGLPGTGKTHLAKAMAAEAGVPFLFVSASEFQSMYYGQTNKKIRSFFKALRKAARDEGGAIGYIEEFDAIGGARSGMNTGSMREGIVGVVNELLVQMQSFDLPTGSQKFKAWWIDWINGFLPDARAQAAPDPQGGQRADRRVDEPRRRPRSGADASRPVRPDHHVRPPGALRPRRDRRVLPRQEEPRRRGHRDRSIADHTAGYTPVRIEKLLDEALIIALRYQRTSMTVSDVLEAQLITEVGIAHEMGYHPDERRRIAIHEAGHALTAVLTRRDVKVASILRRSSALGLVAHGDAEERFLQDAERGPRPDHRRARRPGGGAAGVRRGEQRHLVRPRRGDHDRRPARRSARQRPRPAQPRSGVDADRRQPRRQGAVRRAEP